MHNSNVVDAQQSLCVDFYSETIFRELG